MASRSFAVCFFFGAAVISASGVAQRLSVIDGGHTKSGAGGSLAKSCGASCTSLLQTMVAQLNRTADAPSGAENFDLLSMLAGNVEQSLARAKDLASSPTGSTLAKAASRHRSFRGESRAFESENVPCATPAACAIKAMAANKCNYARVALQGAYNELNVATHVLGVLVSSLCGCVHTGQVSTCALRTLPPVCAFPYTVYSKAFAGSVQVWEAVKAATKKCIIHRDPAIAP